MNDPGKPIRFQTDSFWKGHHAGAFDNGPQIVVDFVKYPNFTSLGELEHTVRSARERLTRAYVEPRSATVRMEPLWDIIRASFHGLTHDDGRASDRIEQTVAARFGIDTFGVGKDCDLQVSNTYKPPLKFTGKIENVAAQLTD